MPAALITLFIHQKLYQETPLRFPSHNLTYIYVFDLYVAEVHARAVDSINLKQTVRIRTNKTCVPGFKSSSMLTDGFG